MDPILVQNLIQAAFLAVIGVIAYGLRGAVGIGIEYARVRLGTERLLVLKEFAATTVRTLQQSPVFEHLETEKKKELAILSMMKFAEDNSIPVDRDFIDRVIEEAVQVMKAEIGKIDWGE